MGLGIIQQTRIWSDEINNFINMILCMYFDMSRSKTNLEILQT